MGGGSILGTEWQAASLVQNTLDRRDSEDVFFSACQFAWLAFGLDL